MYILLLLPRAVNIDIHGLAVSAKDHAGHYVIPLGDVKRSFGTICTGGIVGGQGHIQRAVQAESSQLGLPSVSRYDFAPTCKPNVAEYIARPLPNRNRNPTLTLILILMLTKY